MSEIVAQAIGRLARGESLARPEARAVILAVMDGEATAAQIGALLVAWRMKGETAAEVVGAAEALRARATRVTTTRQPVIDTCGTGGDGTASFNLSTAAALVAAGAGACVAKHGNRAVSSRSGSADVLEALGVEIDLEAAGVGACLDEIGLGFLYAPRFHPAMRHAAAPRREIRMRTLFNLLGPLANPAGASRQLIGAFSVDAARLMATALAELGCELAYVVHGHGGFDEISLSGPTHVFQVAGGAVTEHVVTPEAAGLRTRPAAVGGGTAAENAHLMERVLAAEGEDGDSGAGGTGDIADLRDAVLLNAGAALVVAGLARDLAAGTALAREALLSGAARDRLAALRTFTRARAAAVSPR